MKITDVSMTTILLHLTVTFLSLGITLVADDNLDPSIMEHKIEVKALEGPIVHSWSILKNDFYKTIIHDWFCSLFSVCLEKHFVFVNIKGFSILTFNKLKKRSCYFCQKIIEEQSHGAVSWNELLYKEMTNSSRHEVLIYLSTQGRYQKQWSDWSLINS